MEIFKAMADWENARHKTNKAETPYLLIIIPHSQTYSLTELINLIIAISLESEYYAFTFIIYKHFSYPYLWNGH